MIRFNHATDASIRGESPTGNKTVLRYSPTHSYAMRFLLLPLVVAGMAASATIDAREDLRMARLDDLAYRVEDLERLADLDPNGRVKWSILCMCFPLKM